MGKTAGSAIIRPSKGIIYDTKEAVVSFFSEDVKECMKDFVKEWARVSKMVVIAREGKFTATSDWDWWGTTNTSSWSDVERKEMARYPTIVI